MNTQEYLNQISRLESLIRLKSEQIIKLESQICSTPPTALNPNKVQSSMVGDKLCDSVAKLVDEKNRLSEMIDEYRKQENLIISQIEKMPDTRSYVILMNKYVFRKKYCEIACEPELDCTERRVKQLHKKALTDFDKLFGKEYKNNTATLS